MDLLDDPDSPTVVALIELPGVSKDEIRMHFMGTALCIEGRRLPRLLPSCTDRRNRTLPVTEIIHTRFFRKIPMPPGMHVS